MTLDQFITYLKSFQKQGFGACQVMIPVPDSSDRFDVSAAIPTVKHGRTTDVVYIGEA